MRPEDCFYYIKAYYVLPYGYLFLNDGEGLTLIDFLELRLDLSFLS